MSKWESEITEEFIAVTSPQSFRFEFSTMEQVLDTIEATSFAKQFGFTRNNERFQIIGSEIKVISADPWINKDFRIGDLAAYSSDLALALLQVVKDEYARDTRFRLR